MKRFYREETKETKKHTKHPKNFLKQLKKFSENLYYQYQLLKYKIIEKSIKKKNNSDFPKIVAINDIEITDKIII